MNIDEFNTRYWCNHRTQMTQIKQMLFYTSNRITQRLSELFAGWMK